MGNVSNIRDLAKVQADVHWLKTYDPFCPRQLDGHDGRPSMDPVKWGKIECVDRGIISAVGLTARNNASYVDMHCIYGIVMGIFRVMVFGAIVVSVIYQIWHTVWLFGTLFLVTFALPKLLGRKTHLGLTTPMKERSIR